VAFGRSRHQPNRPQVRLEVTVQVDGAAVRGEHAGREVSGLGEHPRISEGRDTQVEAGARRKSLEGHVVD